VVAEELLVQDPVGVFWADVDVDHGAGEEPKASLSAYVVASHDLSLEVQLKRARRGTRLGTAYTYSWSGLSCGAVMMSDGLFVPNYNNEGTWVYV
jgi:hypothetical protein